MFSSSTLIQVDTTHLRMTCSHLGRNKIDVTRVRRDNESLIVQFLGDVDKQPMNQSVISVVRGSFATSCWSVEVTNDILIENILNQCTSCKMLDIIASKQLAIVHRVSRFTIDSDRVITLGADRTRRKICCFEFHLNVLDARMKIAVEHLSEEYLPCGRVICSEACLECSCLNSDEDTVVLICLTDEDAVSYTASSIFTEQFDVDQVVGTELSKRCPGQHLESE